MITFRNVHHEVRRHNEDITVLAGTDFDFDRRRMGLVAERPEQLEAMIDLLAGYRLPTSGRIRRFGSVSWPIGRLVQFRSELTGRETLRFICRLYGLDFARCVDFVHALVDFQQNWDKKVTEWPRLLNVEFGHAVALLPEFDTYLVDGSLVLSNDRFMADWLPCFEDRIAGRQMIMACNVRPYLARFCRSVAVVKDGKLVYHPSIESAFATVNTIAPAAARNTPRDDRFDEAALLDE